MDPLNDFHMEEAVLIDDERLIGLENKDILHFFPRPFTNHGERREKGWYFHDETGDYHGPYAFAHAANTAATRYIDWLNGRTRFT